MDFDLEKWGATKEKSFISLLESVGINLETLNSQKILVIEKDLNFD